MHSLPEKELWAEVHRRNFLMVGECYTTCGGGFCCNNNHPEVQFKAIPRGQQSFPMLVGEFEYLRELGRLQPGMETNHRVMEVELDNGKYARAYMATCKQGGECYHCETRPLICKIYPYIPYPQLDGTVKTFEVGSVFDLMFHHAGRPSPCTILEGPSEKHFPGLVKQLQFLFDKPYFLFYFQAFYEMGRLLRAGLNKKFPNAAEEDSKEFFKQFEIAYMTGQLVDGGEVSEVLSRVYHNIEKKYGEFAI